MKNLKEKLSKLSVLVFGDMYLDRDCIGDFEGKSKEDENLSILKVHTEKYQPGGAGNLASCFASLGVKTTVVGLWGEKDDINRQILEQQFKNRGIDTSYMVESGKTPVFGKFYTSNGNHIFRYDIVSENMTDEIEEQLTQNIHNAIQDINVSFIACADYNNSGIRDMVCENTLQPILYTKISKFATGRKVIKKFKSFNYLLLNENECKDINEGQMSFIKNMEIDSLIITYSKGATVVDNNGLECISESELLKGEIDTCGCGDMFYAMYSSSIMAEYDVETSLKLANLSAGIVAKKMFGAAQASIDEVISSL